VVWLVVEGLALVEKRIPLNVLHPLRYPPHQARPHVAREVEAALAADERKGVFELRVALLRVHGACPAGSVSGVMWVRASRRTSACCTAASACDSKRAADVLLPRLRRRPAIRRAIAARSSSARSAAQRALSTVSVCSAATVSIE